MDDPASQNLKPLVVVENLKLKARLCKREVVFAPLHFNIAEYLPSQLFQDLLEVSGRNVLGIRHICDTDLIPFEEANTLHLVEDRIVCLVHCVFAIDIAQTQKRAIAVFEEWDLVHARVSAQNRVLVEVVSVRWLAADMVRWDAQGIKAVVSFDNGVEVLEKFELLPRQSNVRDTLRSVEKIVCFGDQGG